MGWDAEPVSMLHPDVCDGDVTGLLAVYSLSKQSNLAGYRAGFVAGDVALVRELVEIRKHAGMIVPRPVQAVVQACTADDAHVSEQRERYARRRAVLLAGVERAGPARRALRGRALPVVHPRRARMGHRRGLARRRVLVAPGEFYGGDARHVRLALTVTDERADLAAERLSRLG
jgi:aspartate/methionine/tyrosine aminotransferase